MYSTTEQCKNIISRSSRTFAASFLLDGVKHSNIKSMKISVLSATTGITIGGTISKSVEIIIEKMDIMSGKTLDVYEGVRLDSGEYEDIPMGKFIVDSATTKDNLTTIKANGPLSMAVLGYFSNLTYPTTTVEMLDEISEMLGVTIETDTLEEIYVETKPEGYTIREVIGYIAGLHGTNAVETRTGNITFKWYEHCDEDIFTDKADSPELNNEVFVVEKFDCTINETTITRGSGYKGIAINNPLMTETIADLVWEKIANFCYRPGTFNIKSGTPLVESWDCFTYNNETIIATELEYIHDGGLQNIYKSVAKSNTSSAAKGPMAIQLERYYAELVLIKETMVYFLTVNEANIRYLQAGDIEAITLEVEQSVIGNLEADFAGVTLANIDVANIDKSSIGLLFAEVGLITDAKIVDGHVTGYLDAVEVNANSVTTGTLSVDRLVFRGQEKSIVYELNNITGALQAVQSDTLNGEILTDRSITVDKIVAKSITTNELNVENIFGNEAVIKKIFAQNVAATGEITGAKLYGTYAEIESGMIGDFDITNGVISYIEDDVYQDTSGNQKSIYWRSFGISPERYSANVDTDTKLMWFGAHPSGYGDSYVDSNGHCLDDYMVYPFYITADGKLVTKSATSSTHTYQHDYNQGTIYATGLVNWSTNMAYIKFTPEATLDSGKLAINDTTYDTMGILHNDVRKLELTESGIYSPKVCTDLLACQGYIGADGVGAGTITGGIVKTTSGADLDTVKDNTTWKSCTVTANTSMGNFYNNSQGAKYRYDDNILEICVRGTYVTGATIANGKTLMTVSGLDIPIPSASAAMMFDTTAQTWRAIGIKTTGELYLYSTASIPANYWLSGTTLNFIIFRA